MTGTRLLLGLRPENGAEMQLRHTSRMALDDTGRLVLYNESNEISEVFEPGEAVLVRIWTSLEGSVP